MSSKVLKAFKPPSKMLASGTGSVPTLSVASNSSATSQPIETLDQNKENFIKARHDELQELEAEILKLQAQGDSVDELQEYIELLHSYNEYKDTAQTLMGQIALMDGVPLKEVAQRFDAPANLD